MNITKQEHIEDIEFREITDQEINEKENESSPDIEDSSFDEKSEVKYNDDEFLELSLTRSNVLIESGFNATLLENKLLVLGLTKYQYSGCEKAYFSVNEIKEFTGIDDSNYLYSKLKNAAVGIARSLFTIEDPKSKSFIVSNVVTNAVYHNGTLMMEFNKAIHPFIHQLTNNYTKMNLSILMSFDNSKRSNIAFRIYELLKVRKYKIKKGRKAYYKRFGLSEFIYKAGLIDTSNKNVINALNRTKDWDYVVYEVAKFNKTWGDVKRRFLDPAKEENNKVTDIMFDYCVDRTGLGGKVTSIIFKIEDNPNFEKRVKQSDSEEDDSIDLTLMVALENIIKEPLSAANKKALLKAADNDLERIANAYSVAKLQRNTIREFVPWMITAIRENFDKNFPMAAAPTEEEKEQDALEIAFEAAKNKRKK